MERASISVLTICGLDELEGHGSRGVTHILSILDPGWPDPTVFGGWDRFHRVTLRFHDIVDPLPGQVLPEPDDVAEILSFGRALEEDAAGREQGHLLVHCHAGISRSTAAMTMLLAQTYPGEDEESIIERLVAIRPQAWPNGRMIGFADEQLGRGGRLSAAVSRLHARQMAAKPHLADVMSELGRSREVDSARAIAA
jgi:predicted protein tyrosine phosphatase